jgi:GNAT superfamily N-acetyltransferase
MSVACDVAAVRRLDAAGAEARIDELAAILVDAVMHGASVNFLAGLSMADAAAFWRGQMAGIAAGSRILLVLEEQHTIVGTVMLTLAHQPNAPHRAEISKMLVRSTARRRGFGTCLLQAAEQMARAYGRTLLLLDTQTGSAGEHLYRSCDWTPLGVVPDHALTPDGRPAATTFFYKRLAPP